jgi:hypothetical protein
MIVNWEMWGVVVGVLSLGATVGLPYLAWRRKKGPDLMVEKSTKKRTVKQAQRQSGGGVQVQKQQVGDAVAVQAQRQGSVQEQSQEVTEEND